MFSVSRFYNRIVYSGASDFIYRLWLLLNKFPFFFGHCQCCYIPDNSFCFTIVRCVSEHFIDIRNGAKTPNPMPCYLVLSTVSNILGSAPQTLYRKWKINDDDQIELSFWDEKMEILYKQWSAEERKFQIQTIVLMILTLVCNTVASNDYHLSTIQNQTFSFNINSDAQLVSKWRKMLVINFWMNQ